MASHLRAHGSQAAPEDVRIDRVLFLGTGSAVPVPGQRNMSSLAVLLSSGAAIMVDCGEGTQHHLRVSTMLRASRLEAILLTHLHGDHCFGIFGLLHTAAMEGRKDPMLLVGPVGIREMVETVFRCSGGWFPADCFELQFLEIPTCGAPGRDSLVGEDGAGFSAEKCRTAAPVDLGLVGGMRLQAVPLVHSVPDWGYVLTEPDRPGVLDVKSAMSMGVPKGPQLGRLKSGEAVTLADGRVVSPHQVVGPRILGRTVAVLQDTSDASAAIEPCRGAAVVVHEATFAADMEQDALAKGHSTSAMAADFALRCGAKRLVLTHFSARYSTSDALAPAAADGGPPADPAGRLGEEARAVLGPEGAPVVVAQDFMVLRGDRDFEPEPLLAVKRPPWHRQAVDVLMGDFAAAKRACAHLAPCKC